MKQWLALALAFDSLRSNLLRTVLSTLGVVIGVASLVAVLALGDGMERFAREQIQNEGYQTVSIQPIEDETVDGISIAKPNVVELTAADAAELSRVLPPGSDVSMTRQGTSLVTGPAGGRARGALVFGVLPRPSKPPHKLVHGRLLTVEEAARGDRVALISKALATELVKPQQPATLVGQNISFNDSAERQVIGVIDAQQGQMGNMIVVPIEGVSDVMMAGRRSRAAVLEVHAPAIEAVDSVKAKLEAWAAKRWKEPNREIRISSLGQQRLEQLQRGVLLFKMFMGAIVGISLVVGGIGIMNVLLGSVIERTREIGIRKTTGARNGEILQQFLAESVVVTGVGALMGIGLGLPAAFGFTAIMRRVTEAQIYAAFDVGSLMIAALVSIMVGLIFGTYPARRAAQLSPIEAVRHE